MFYCHKCRSLSKPNEGQTKVVIEVRKKVYHGRDGKPQGEGFETVKEIAVAACCRPKAE